MSSRTRVAVAAVVLAVLVVSAGCGALDLGEDRGTYDVPDRTTTATTTATVAGTGPDEDRVTGPRTTIPPAGDPPDGDEALAVQERVGNVPGIVDGEVTRPDRLAAAHRTALFERAFRVRLNHTVRYANGSRRTVDTAAVVSANRSRYAVDRAIRGAEGGRSWVQVRSTGETVYLSVTGDGPGRERYDEPGVESVPERNCTVVDLPDPSYHGTVERAFEATEVDWIGPVDGDPELFRITGEGADARRIDPAATGVENLTLDAVVASSGVVRYLRVSYRATVDGTPATVTTTLRVFEVGTAVPAPRRLAGPRVVEVPTGGADQC